MAKIPKQRGGGQSGNTSWGHRSNRVSSMGRGGNPHAGGGGGGKKGGCLSALIIFTAGAGSLTYGLTHIL
jgi:hypothetical protein